MPRDGGYTQQLLAPGDRALCSKSAPRDYFLLFLPFLLAASSSSLTRSSSAAWMYRRKLNLKPKFESSPSYSSFKRLVLGGFNLV